MDVISEDENKAFLMKLLASRNSNLGEQVINDIQTLISLCGEDELVQPEIYTYADVDENGIQAAWDFDWYIEVDISENGIRFFAVKNNDDEHSFECAFRNIKETYQLIKLFLLYIVLN